MWCAQSNSSGSSGPGNGDGQSGEHRRREPSQGGGEHGRLNLLLSDAGWWQEGWAEGLPRLLEPLGVRSWRVQTGQDAARLLQAEPIHIAVVDLSLPLEASDEEGDAGQAEGGQRLLQLLARLRTPPPTIVIKRPKTSRDDARELACALRLGAFAVVDRPVQMELILEVFRRVLRRHYAGRWPGEGRTPPPSGPQWV